jgi:hypothetical protein
VQAFDSAICDLAYPELIPNSWAMLGTAVFEEAHNPALLSVKQDSSHKTAIPGGRKQLYQYGKPFISTKAMRYQKV